tara:strand:- start:68 stop:454 length:387 start_codon:yes stop_codon:yes gene_type:complete
MNTEVKVKTEKKVILIKSLEEVVDEVLKQVGYSLQDFHISEYEPSLETEDWGGGEVTVKMDMGNTIYPSDLMSDVKGDVMKNMIPEETIDTTIKSEDDEKEEEGDDMTYVEPKKAAIKSVKIDMSEKD